MINKFRNMREDIISNYSSKVKNKAKNLEKNEIISLIKEMLKRTEITLGCGRGRRRTAHAPG